MTTRYKPASPRQPAVRQQTSQTTTERPPSGNTAQNAGGWTPEPIRVGFGAGITGPTTPRLDGPCCGGSKWPFGILSKGKECVAIIPAQDLEFQPSAGNHEATVQRMADCYNNLAGIRNPAAIPAVVEAARKLIESVGLNYPTDLEDIARMLDRLAAPSGRLEEALAELDRQP